jgi:hypothetical protein
MKEWIWLNLLRPVHWANLDLPTWWNMMADGRMPNRKAMDFITLLVSCEVWNKRDSRVFRNKCAMSHVVFDKIKKEVRLWVLAGARRSSDLMPQE